MSICVYSRVRAFRYSVRGIHSFCVENGVFPGNWFESSGHGGLLMISIPVIFNPLPGRFDIFWIEYHQIRDGIFIPPGKEFILPGRPFILRLLTVYGGNHYYAQKLYGGIIIHEKITNSYDSAIFDGPVPGGDWFF